jgi:hypothetical protein
MWARTGLSDGGFELSQNDRALVRVRAGVASTVAIKGQPKDQRLGLFLEKVRSLVSEQEVAGDAR